jgi:hypothetical protein
VLQVSIDQLMHQVKELKVFGDDAPFRLNDWLKSFLDGEQPLVMIEGNAREQTKEELDLDPKRSGGETGY